MGKTVRREKPEPRRERGFPEPAPSVRHAAHRATFVIIEMHEDDEDDLVLITCPVTKIPGILLSVAHNGAEIVGRLPPTIPALATQIERAITRSRRDFSSVRAFFYTRGEKRMDRSRTIEKQLRDELHIVAEFLTEKHWPKKIRRALGLPPAA